MPIKLQLRISVLPIACFYFTRVAGLRQLGIKAFLVVEWRCLSSLRLQLSHPHAPQHRSQAKMSCCLGLTYEILVTLSKKIHRQAT